MSMFQKAVRKQVPLKVALAGSSGSGKSKGALALAAAFAESHGSRFAVIDTENRSASLYADQWDFDTADITAPHEPEKYIKALSAAMEAGYKVVVIDSLSHAWLYINDAKTEEEYRTKANGFTLWGKYGARWEKLMTAIKEAPIDIIVTMRAKQAYEISKSSNGKNQVQKLGMAPQVRDSAEFEFDVTFDISREHVATSGKDRTEVFEGGEWDLLDPKVGQKLLAWRDSAPQPDERPKFTKPQPAKAEPEAATPEQIKALADAAETGRQYLDHKALEWVEKVEITGCTAAQAEAALARFEAARKEWEAKQGAGEVPKAGRVSDALEESAEKKEDAKKPEPDDNAMTKEQVAALKTYSKARWLPDAWRKKLALDLKVGMDRPTAAKWLTAIKEKSDALEKEAVAAEAAKDAEAA